MSVIAELQKEIQTTVDDDDLADLVEQITELDDGVRLVGDHVEITNTKGASIDVGVITKLFVLGAGEGLHAGEDYLYLRNNNNHYIGYPLSRAILFYDRLPSPDPELKKETPKQTKKRLAKELDYRKQHNILDRKTKQVYSKSSSSKSNSTGSVKRALDLENGLITVGGTRSVIAGTYKIVTGEIGATRAAASKGLANYPKQEGFGYCVANYFDDETKVRSHFGIEVPAESWKKEEDLHSE